MAKELPYFKFEPNQWENGNIQMMSREDKGLFIDLCSMYWAAAAARAADSDAARDEQSIKLQKIVFEESENE